MNRYKAKIKKLQDVIHKYSEDIEIVKINISNLKDDINKIKQTKFFLKNPIKKNVKNPIKKNVKKPIKKKKSKKTVSKKVVNKDTNILIQKGGDKCYAVDINGKDVELSGTIGTDGSFKTLTNNIKCVAESIGGAHFQK